MFNRKNKELQALVNSSRKALKEAESKIQNRNMFITDKEKQVEILKQTNRNLKLKLEEKEILISRIKMLATSNKYGNEKLILDKIIELVRPLNQN